MCVFLSAYLKTCIRRSAECDLSIRTVSDAAAPARYPCMRSLRSFSIVKLNDLHLLATTTATEKALLVVNS